MGLILVSLCVKVSLSIQVGGLLPKSLHASQEQCGVKAASSPGGPLTTDRCDFAWLLYYLPLGIRIFNPVDLRILKSK